MKSRIFIGSSSEGLSVAERIKEFFEPEYECYIWNDGVFKYNEGFLETLVKSASLFDFGFMVFAADDMSRIRHREYTTTRDNVLFEYGLFLGRVGLDRAFVLIEDGVKIPSDLHGVTMLSYKTVEGGNGEKMPDSDFEKSLAVLKTTIDERVSLGYLGLLPSTVIAISYYENFVKLLADEIVRQGDKVQIGNQTYSSAKIRVVIPSTLDADMKRQATMYFRKLNYKSCSISTAHRNYPIYVESVTDADAGGHIVIADLPTILNGIDRAIDIYFKVGYIGKTYEQQLTEERELSNFTRVLKMLISQDAYCREIVELVDENNHLIF